MEYVEYLIMAMNRFKVHVAIFADQYRLTCICNSSLLTPVQCSQRTLCRTICLRKTRYWGVEALLPSVQKPADCHARCLLEPRRRQPCQAIVCRRPHACAFLDWAVFGWRFGWDPTNIAYVTRIRRDSCCEYSTSKKGDSTARENCQATNICVTDRV